MLELVLVEWRSRIMYFCPPLLMPCDKSITKEEFTSPFSNVPLSPLLEIPCPPPSNQGLCHFICFIDMRFYSSI